MTSIGLKDKAGRELAVGDQVQIVNGANAGTRLYKIRACNRPYTIEGDLNPTNPALGTMQIVCKKVRKV